MKFEQVLGWFYSSLGVWFLFLTIYGRNPKNQMHTIGTLIQKKTKRNVAGRHCTIPVITDYTYSYTVNGKEYRIRHSVQNTKRGIMKKATIVYLKGFPRCAGIEQYHNSLHGFLSALLLLGGILMILLFS